MWKNCGEFSHKKKKAGDKVGKIALTILKIKS
jgi:hypothetical protein